MILETALIDSGKLLTGVLFGLAAVLAWALYNIGSSAGRAAGFSAADLTLLRYAGATLALTPFILQRGFSAVRSLNLTRVLAFVIFAGPPFALAVTQGFALAPLSHAVVISPGCAMLVSAFLAAISVRQVIPLCRAAGMSLMILGLILVAAGRAGSGGAPVSYWQGDLCFIVSGTLWGCFTFVLGRWKLDPVLVTWAIALVSLTIMILAYSFLPSGSAQPLESWLFQLVIQGLLGGGFSIVLYAICIGRLGTARAGICPALVPVGTVLLAIPLTGKLPENYEMAGIFFATSGMVLALFGTANTSVEMRKAT
jgi:drug/metabolite transporter (DMT)-like permease